MTTIRTTISDGPSGLLRLEAVSEGRGAPSYLTGIDHQGGRWSGLPSRHVLISEELLRSIATAWLSHEVRKSADQIEEELSDVEERLRDACREAGVPIPDPVPEDRLPLAEPICLACFHGHHSGCTGETGASGQPSLGPCRCAERDHDNVHAGGVHDETGAIYGYWPAAERDPGPHDENTDVALDWGSRNTTVVAVRQLKAAMAEFFRAVADAIYPEEHQ